jgi:protein N-terminal glutamine amidohydrolase
LVDFRGFFPQDYHVVLIFAPALTSTAKVFDFDSVLEFPCSLDVYLRAALRPNSDWKLRTFLRLIPAEEFLNQFASDRSHMWNEKLQKYSSPPPSYPCIGSENCENNIEDFINMTNEERGLVIELEYFAWKLENSRTVLFSDSMKSLEKSKTENRKCSNQFPSS